MTKKGISIDFLSKKGIHVNFLTIKGISVDFLTKKGMSVDFLIQNGGLEEIQLMSCVFHICTAVMKPFVGKTSPSL